MSVRIRLRRQGGKNEPFYRVVVADARHPNQGRFIEMVGWYDPLKKGTNFKLEHSRIDYWIGQGAEVSDTVRSFLKKARKAAAGA